MVFQLIAAAVLLLFYGCYFGKMLIQRKKGIQTDQLGKGKKGMVARIETATKISAIAVPIAEIISITLNLTALPSWARWIGALIAPLGTAVFVCSVVTMRDSWRAGVPETDKTELVTTGIYQISRNPAFLGFDLVYAGIALMFFHPVLLAVSAFAALMIHLQIVYAEEPFLLHTFGTAYSDYRNTVNRYLGRKAG